MEGLRDVGDVVLHYVELFDQLGLHEGVNLVGFSLGGRIGARFAIDQKHRLRRLVLVAPQGCASQASRCRTSSRSRPKSSCRGSSTT